MASNTQGVVKRQRDIHAEGGHAGGQEADRSRAMASNRRRRRGARKYRVPPLPNQHQPKPGLELKLEPKPMYDALCFLASPQTSSYITGENHRRLLRRLSGLRCSGGATPP